MKTIKIGALLSLFLISSASIAQKPTEVPKPSEKPIDLTNPADIIIYIVLPLCAILFFFIWRGRKKKSKE
jgi:heme/copper-type cytochrome/quinol oxidase subunit 2